MSPTPERRSRARSPNPRSLQVRQFLLLALVIAGVYFLVEVDPFRFFSSTASRPPEVSSPEPTRQSSASPTPFLPASETPWLLTTVQALPAWTATVSASHQPEATIESPAAVVAPPPEAQASDSWWSVYFVEPQPTGAPFVQNGTAVEKLIAEIDAAETRIDIAAFEFNLTPVAEALIAAHRRGVAIRWITDDEHGLEADKDAGHGQFKLLAQAGISIRTDERRALMHHKFLVFDRQIVWTGSTNLTKNDNFLNNNNVIIIHSPRLANIYSAQFEDMWAGNFGSRSPSDPVAQKLVIQETPVQVLFSPEDNAISYLVPIIQNARESVRFMAFSYTHDELTEAMLERDAAGVEVTGIFETRGSRTPYSALGQLFCAGLPVRQDGNPRTFHHKVLIVDERIVVTGSLNFSDNANEPNNENTLVIENPAIAGEYLQEFERRWEEAKPPNPAHFACQ